MIASNFGSTQTGSAVESAIHAPAIDVGGAPGRDHRVAPVHEGVQHALAKGRLPDYDDPHISHCAQPPATGLDAAPEYTIWHLAGQRRPIRLVGAALCGRLDVTGTGVDPRVGAQ